MSQPKRSGPGRPEKIAEQIPLEDMRTELSTLPSPTVPPAAGTPERLAAERKLVRKLDFRLLPAIATIFILNYIDRTGITAARLKGFEKDLGLSDLQYSVILSIYYAVYCPAQIPSNMILNKITRPSVYIGACVVVWGLISALTGIATNYGQIIACRILLALPECAFYPGAMYLLSCWYTKKELTLRASILYAGLEISNGFGSLMAAGIFSGMEGVKGIRAWRWLFLIEGSITMTVGFLMMWILPDYTHNTRWMSPTERRLAQTRIAEDVGEADKDTEDDTSFRGLKMALRDPMVSLFALTGVIGLLGNSYGFFFPTLASTLGFNTTVTLLLAAAPWVFATVLCCANSWHAGRTGEFFFHISLWSCGTVIGMIIAICTMSVPVRYFSMFLMVSSSAAGGMLLPWVANAVPRPPAKRAAAIAVVNGVLNLGGLIGSYTWRAEWGPRYHNSMIICITSLVLSTLGLFVIRQVLIRKNQQLDRDEAVALAVMNSARVKDAAILEGITYEEATERRKRVRYLY